MSIKKGEAMLEYQVLFARGGSQTVQADGVNYRDNHAYLYIERNDGFHEIIAVYPENKIKGISNINSLK